MSKPILQPLACVCNIRQIISPCDFVFVSADKLCRVLKTVIHRILSDKSSTQSLTAAGLETVKLTPETYSTALTALLDSHSDSAYSQVEAYAVEEIRTQVKAVVAEQIRATITNNTDMMAQIDAGVETAYGTEIDTLAQN